MEETRQGEKKKTRTRLLDDDDDERRRDASVLPSVTATSESKKESIGSRAV